MLQSNKIKELCSIPNLWAIESVDSIKKVQLIAKYWKGIKGECDSIFKSNSNYRLKLFVQIRNNDQMEKLQNDCNDLSLLSLDILMICQEILKYPNLELFGLMIMGSRENCKKEFELALELRKGILTSLGMEKLELSMGMSNDYQIAVTIINFL